MTWVAIVAVSFVVLVVLTAQSRAYKRRCAQDKATKHKDGYYLVSIDGHDLVVETDHDEPVAFYDKLTGADASRSNGVDRAYAIVQKLIVLEEAKGRAAKWNKS